MILATRSRRRRTAFAKITMLVTLSVLLFTPRFELGGTQTQANFAPQPFAVHGS